MIELILHGGDMKRFYQSFCGLILLLIVTVNAQGSSPFNFPEKEFDTPEAAIRHFVESIAKNDAMAALEAFAINDYADKFDFTAWSNRIGAIDFTSSLRPLSILCICSLIVWSCSRNMPNK
jgi:hypothetical protein